MRKTIALALVIMFWGFAAEAGKAARERYPGFCQIVDVPAEPVCALSAGLIPSRNVDGGGSLSEFAIDGHWNFAHFWDVIHGDMDLGLKVRNIWFPDAQGLELPRELLRTAFDAEWNGRFGDGMSLRLNVSPGIHTDIRELGFENVYIPFSAAFIKAVNPRFSEMIGLEIRPGYERAVIPLIGVVWAPDDRVRLDLRFPESRFMFYAGKGLSVHCGFQWDSTTYTILEDLASAPGKDKITLEDSRLFVGATYKVSDQFQITGDFGQVTGRRVELGGGSDVEMDVDSGTFLRVTFGGPF